MLLGGVLKCYASVGVGRYQGCVGLQSKRRLVKINESESVVKVIGCLVKMVRGLLLFVMVSMVVI